MLNKKSVAEKSLTKFMQFLKNEEISLQKQIPLIHARLSHNKIMQTVLLKIVSMEDEKKMLGKCLFKEKRSSNFCGRKTVKNSNYCAKHKKELNGARQI